MCCNIEQASLTYGKIREYLHIFTGIYFTNNVTITICVWTNDETEDFFWGELNYGIVIDWDIMNTDIHEYSTETSGFSDSLYSHKPISTPTMSRPTKIQVP